MIYLDNHATTRCDPRVVEAMVPWLAEHYGNPHSSHELGKVAGQAIETSVEQLARLLNAPAESIVMTSGATESNNLAIRGFCTHPRQKRRHIVTVTTEHPAVLDVASDLEREGFRVTRVPVAPIDDPDAGVVDLQRLEEAIDDMIEHKQGLAEAIVGSDESWITNLSDEDIAELVALREDRI